MQNPTSFPAPHRLGESCTRWALSELLSFEAARDGRPVPADRTPEQECYLSARQVAKRYGTGQTTVWRWAREAQR
jgi:predicted DNA-binding transcriptional regulator AlpA